MKAYVWSNGCVDNYCDELQIKAFLIKERWALTENPKNADLIVINTCAFTKDKENAAIEKIGSLLKTKKPNAKIMVGGCLPSINRKRLRSVFDGPTFTARDIEAFNISAHEMSATKTKYPSEKERAGEKLAASRIEDLYLTIYRKQYFRDYLDKTFLIKTSTGCLGNCSYCSEKRAKGSLKSRPAALIIEDLKTGLRQGFTKFVLVGDDVGAYGQDLKNGQNIATLLKKLIAVGPNYKIAIRHANPEWVIKYHKELSSILRSGKISSIMIPVQSGSDKILNLMRRKYRVKILKKRLSELRKNAPKVKFYTHILVGFPGETEKDFDQTLSLIDAIKFNLIYIYRFQERPATPAIKLSGKVPEGIKNSRFLQVSQKALSQLSENGIDY